jgi:hypothetical protein
MHEAGSRPFLPGGSVSQKKVTVEGFVTPKVLPALVGDSPKIFRECFRFRLHHESSNGSLKMGWIQQVTNGSQS